MEKLLKRKMRCIQLFWSIDMYKDYLCCIFEILEKNMAINNEE